MPAKCPYKAFSIVWGSVHLEYWQITDPPNHSLGTGAQIASPEVVWGHHSIGTTAKPVLSQKKRLPLIVKQHN